MTSVLPIPRGLHLVTTLRGHTGEIRRLAWSPAGLRIATPASDRSVRIWDVESGAQRVLSGHSDTVYAVAWSPDGSRLVSGGRDGTIVLWDTETGAQLALITQQDSWVNSLAWSRDGRLAAGFESGDIYLWDLGSDGSRASVPEVSVIDVGLPKYYSGVHSVAWAPDGGSLAAAGGDGEVRLWGRDGQLRGALRGHHQTAFTLDWSSVTRLASGGWDRTVRLWDLVTRRELATLQGFLGPISSVSFSADGRLLAVKGGEDLVRIFGVDADQPVALLPEETSGRNSPSLAFHPTRPLLATLGDRDTCVRIWQVDIEVLLSGAAPEDHVQYRNAKVVLLGDSGVGKTALALALTGQGFQPTESTHGRNVSTLDSTSVTLPDGLAEVREVLLWDTAGQPGYRLIHQLHLDEVSAALVVCDARSETNPFAGVQHWRRALAQAQQLRGSGAPRLRTFLVAARTDRGGIGVSQKRIDSLLHDLGFDRFLETSAKTGAGVSELGAAIRDAIAWDELPMISSTRLLEEIRGFLLGRRRANRNLASMVDLYDEFRDTHPEHHDDPLLRPKFETCVRLMENQRLIRRLSFGGQVLLRPELLDTYASAIVIAAREEPDGLGCLAEDRVRTADFPLPEDERVPDRQQERLLLNATAEELMRYEIAFKESTDAGVDIVFPSQFTRDRPAAPQLPHSTVAFTFNGPVLSVYATLTVRLARSLVFAKAEMWHNAATFEAAAGGHCGIQLREIDEAAAELALFFDSAATEQTRHQFERYVAVHLARRALPSSVLRISRVVCPKCGEQYSADTVKARRDRGHTTLSCVVCGTLVALGEPTGQSGAAAATVGRMDAAADAGRDRDMALMIVNGKRDAGDYDVFFSYNSADYGAVADIGRRLEECGILAFIANRDLPAGELWQPEVQRRLSGLASAAVFIGSHGVGRWQHEEINVLLERATGGQCLVIPVRLDSSPAELPTVLTFLAARTWVDFRTTYPDPMDKLGRAIRSKRADM